MDTTPVTEPDATAVPAPPLRRTGRLRRLLRAVTVAACLPYLTLKLLWLGGSAVGIPPGSPLLAADGATALRAVNALTLLMDVCVIVLALALTTPRGRRLPGWSLAVPLWIATGLLAPIVVGAPLQAVLSGPAGLSGRGGPDAAAAEPFLDAWVFTVVYAGFGVQGLALGGLFAAEARTRWGRLLRGGNGPRPLPTGPRWALTATAAACLHPATLHLRAATDPAATGAFVEWLHTGFALGAAAGLLALAHLPAAARERHGTVAVGAAWTGSAVLGAWGGWWLLVGSVEAGGIGGGDSGGQGPLLDRFAYSAQMTVGLLAAGALVGALRAGQAPDGARRSAC